MPPPPRSGAPTPAAHPGALVESSSEFAPCATAGRTRLGPPPRVVVFFSRACGLRRPRSPRPARTVPHRAWAQHRHPALSPGGGWPSRPLLRGGEGYCDHRKNGKLIATACTKAPGAPPEGGRLTLSRLQPPPYPPPCGTSYWAAPTQLRFCTGVFHGALYHGRRHRGTVQSSVHPRGRRNPPARFPERGRPAGPVESHSAVCGRPERKRC